MILLGTNTSPYVRKMRLVLLEKNIPHDYLVDPPREPGSQVVRVNPLGRIPALILDDETCIFDSPVIAEYADTLNDTPILIPRDDALARMRVKRWEALADGIMDSAVVVRTERLRPGGTPSKPPRWTCITMPSRARCLMPPSSLASINGAREHRSRWPIWRWSAR